MDHRKLSCLLKDLIYLLTQHQKFGTVYKKFWLGFGLDSRAGKPNKVDYLIMKNYVQHILLNTIIIVQDDLFK